MTEEWGVGGGGADRVRERQRQTDRQTERGRGLRDFLFNTTDGKIMTTTIAAVVPASAVSQSSKQYKQEQHMVPATAVNNK